MAFDTRLLANALRHRRYVVRRITQRNAAREIGIDFTTVSLLENEKMLNPSIELLEKVCRWLARPVDDFLRHDGADSDADSGDDEAHADAEAA